MYTVLQYHVDLINTSSVVTYILRIFVCMLYLYIYLFVNFVKRLHTYHIYILIIYQIEINVKQLKIQN